MVAPATAVQIAPNPNPAGSTIDIIDDVTAVNDLNPFDNLGTIQILSVAQNAELTNNGTLNNNGTVNISSGGTAALTNHGTLTNNGTMTGGFLSNGGTLSNNGNMEGQNLENHGQWTNTGFLNTNAIYNDGTFTNSSPFQSAGDISNAGTLTNNSSIIGTTTYTQFDGQTINNGSLTHGDNIDIHGGSLSGLGTVTTPTLTLASGATLSPGTTTQLGPLSLNGNLQSSGNLNFRFGGLNAGEFDVLKINGNASFTGGNLVLNFVNGFTAAVGNSWQFLTASAVSGWNSLLVRVNGLAAGLGYEITSANGAQTLTITGTPASVPEPSSLLLLGAGLIGLISFRRKLSSHQSKD